MKIGILGKLVHCRRWNGARDRYSRGHLHTSGEHKEQSMRSIELDVQIFRRIRVGQPYKADGCIFVRDYHSFRMVFTSDSFFWTVD
jgi:hypothetical protein